MAIRKWLPRGEKNSSSVPGVCDKKGGGDGNGEPTKVHRGVKTWEANGLNREDMLEEYLRFVEEKWEGAKGELQEEVCRTLRCDDDQSGVGGADKLVPYGVGSGKVFGFENYGNTCYCNSILQCLFNLEELRKSILQYPKRVDTEQRKRKVNFGVTWKSENAISSNSNSNNAVSSPSVSSNGSPASSASSALSASSATSVDSNRTVGSKEAGAPVERAESVGTACDAMLGGLHDDNNRVIVGRIPSKGLSRSQRSSTTCVCMGTDGRASSGSSVMTTTNSSACACGGTGNGALKGRSSGEQRKVAAIMAGPVLQIDQSALSGCFPNEKTPSLYSALKDVYECIVETRSMLGVVSPSKFVSVLRQENILFDNTMHQDAHEFLNFLMNSLSDTLEREMAVAPERTMENYIQKLFQGTVTNSIKCLTCDNVTSSDEPFLDLAIPVNENEKVDVQLVLSDFHQREMLNGSNKFSCDSCNGLQEAERTVVLKQLPKILSLHLKRFKYSDKHRSNIKLFNQVTYPLKMTVCSTSDVNICKNYQLNGVIVHMGAGPQHGHYVAICKHQYYGWLLYDDETVESVSEETVLRFIGDEKDLTTAYVLFYTEITEADGTMTHSPQYYNKNIDQLLRFDDWFRSVNIDDAFSSISTEPDMTPYPSNQLKQVPEEESHSQVERKASMHNNTRNSAANIAQVNNNSPRLGVSVAGSDSITNGNNVSTGKRLGRSEEGKGCYSNPENASSSSRLSRLFSFKRKSYIKT